MRTGFAIAALFFWMALARPAWSQEREVHAEGVVRWVAGELVYVEAPFDEMLKRNRQRAGAVPESVLRKLLAKLEIPGPAEAHHVQYEVY